MKAHTRRIFKPGNYRLRVKKSRTGRGMYAEELIPKGACIIEYFGPPATPAQLKRESSKYLFETSKTTTINGNIPENKARFINHSCKPNCEVEIHQQRVFIFALRTIRPGEELTYDYGEEYFEEFFSKGRCQCSKCLLARQKVVL